MRNRTLKFTLGFIVVGLVIITLIIFVQRNALSLYHKHLSYTRLSDQLENQVVHAQFLLEQIKVGNTSINFESDVLAPLLETKMVLEGAYDGTETDQGKLEKEKDEAVRLLLKETIYSIQNLSEVSQVRWNTKTEIISPATDSTEAVYDTKTVEVLNLELDGAFRNFQTSSSRLVSFVNQHLTADVSGLSALSWLSIAGLVSAFIVGCILFYRLLHTKEILQREKASDLEQQAQSASSLSNFMEAISAGNYSTELDLAINNGSMANTLVTMRDKLRTNAEEDNRRNWTTSGLAQIGELLRTSFAKTQDLFDGIMNFVVKYTKSNQGGLFILNEENKDKPFLELVACYAYERKKYLTKTIEIGEGLVGQSFLEADSIYLVDVPKEYIAITSSLGEATPNALLLVPLKVNGKVFGILELATFGKYETHERELVEKLAESIASTISTVRINESTRILLEKTQQQTEEMRAQEEEMRQNMEELEATQEEMRRKEKHIQTMLDNEKARNEVSNKNRQAIMELSRKKDILEGKWDGALDKITGSITRQLAVSRAAVWSHVPKENKLFCEKLFDQNNKKFQSGEVWYGKDYPGYFEAITSEEIISAKDAHSHSATRELSETYLHRNGIKSMLVLPYFNEGKMAGIICCEQHEQKDWTEEDIEFVKACADLVALAFNNRRINTIMEKLSDDQETMQTIIDNIPRAVFWKGKDLRFQGCNKIFANVAGLKSYHDLIGRTDYDMPWREHGDAYRADDLAVMNSRKARLDLEEKNVNNDGNVSWVLTSKVPVMNKHGETVAVLGMFEDITLRKLQDEDIASKLQELELLKKMIEKGNK